MIRVFLGPGGVNLENARQARSNRISSRWSSTPEKILPNFLTALRRVYGRPTT